jgi:hypothetical protein
MSLPTPRVDLGRLQVHAVCTGCDHMAELDLTTGRSWWLFVGPGLPGRFVVLAQLLFRAFHCYISPPKSGQKVRIL